MYKEATAKFKIYENAPEFPHAKVFDKVEDIYPKLFKATSENISSIITRPNKVKVVNGEQLTHLRFADDIILIAKDPTISNLNSTSNEVGLKRNLLKTCITNL